MQLQFILNYIIEFFHISEMPELQIQERVTPSENTEWMVISVLSQTVASRLSVNLKV